MTKTRKKSDTFDRNAWRDKIRSAGLRSTSARIAALQVLFDSSTPLSHADLVEAVEGQGFDRATIYRNLNDLAEAGLVSKRDLGDHTWRFELRREGAPEHATAHPHFTCTDCGTVSCLPDAAVGIRSGSEVPKAVLSRRVQVTLQGICDECD